MTPYEIALRLMRSRTSTGHPDFIVAYLLAEKERDRYAFASPMSAAAQRIAVALKALSFPALATAGALELAFKRVAEIEAARERLVLPMPAYRPGEPLPFSEHDEEWAAVIEARIDLDAGHAIYRHVCETCGLLGGWADSPEQARDDRPASCKAHDDSRNPIPAVWDARKANA